MAASFAISSGIVLALVYVSPDVIKYVRPKDPTLINIAPEPEPPIEKPVDQPEHKMPVRQQPIVAPDPLVPTLVDPTPLDTTTKVPEFVLPPPPPIPGGDMGAAVEPPKPLPLIGASFDPRYAAAMQPEYPSIEIRNGAEGRVTVRVLIGTDGRVKQVEKVSATSEAFYEATRDRALKRWRFKPATRGGIPEESWKQMSVRFELDSIK